MPEYNIYRLTLESGAVVRIGGVNAQHARSEYVTSIMICGGIPERVVDEEIEP